MFPVIKLTDQLLVKIKWATQTFTVKNFISVSKMYQKCIKKYSENYNKLGYNYKGKSVIIYREGRKIILYSSRHFLRSYINA